MIKMVEAQPADTDGSFRASVHVAAEEGDAAIVTVEEHGFWGALSFVDLLLANAHRRQLEDRQQDIHADRRIALGKLRSVGVSPRGAPTVSVDPGLASPALAPQRSSCGRA